MRGKVDDPGVFKCVAHRLYCRIAIQLRLHMVNCGYRVGLV